MTEHDPMCPERPWNFAERDCQCDLIARVVEREQDTKFAQLDHAEAVAAKLVEVICDRESDYRNALWELGVAHDMHDAVTEVLNQTRAEVERVMDERDAARAEAERLRSPEWEAEVRADERAVAQVQACDFHIVQVRWAEAVAARLVEVICEMQAEADEEDAYFLTSYQRIRDERDAARAQSAAAQAEARVAESEVRVLAAEVAALREQLERAPDGWEIVVAEKKGRREVLADLREQVLMLEHDDSCSEIRQEAPCDCLRGSVLALIEEADRG